MIKRIMILLMIVCVTAIYGNQKIGSLVFYDYTYDLTENAENDAGFKASRVYLTFSNKLDENLSIKIQTDIDYKNTPRNVYLKNAKVDWKTTNGKITIGLQGMNIFGVQEKTWGYRFIEKSAMDRKKFSSSADMGIGYSNTFGNNIHISALYTNGAGYKKSENDSHKKISFLGMMGPKKLSSKDGFNIGAVFSYEPYDFDSVTVENKTVKGIFGGFSGNKIRLGVEVNSFNDVGIDLSKQLISSYAVYKVSDKLNIFGRYDMFDPDTNTDDDSEDYILAGFELMPGKGLYIAPNLRMTTPGGGDKTTVFCVNFQFKF